MFTRLRSRACTANASAVNFPVRKPKESSRKKKQHSDSDVEDLGARIEEAKDNVASAWEPPLWRTQLKNIRQMRSKRDAPVDSVGCSELADRSDGDRTYRFQILISLMLSSQTKDAVTAAAMSNLKKQGCTAEKIAAMSEADLAALIYPVGFAKQKAKYIKHTSALLVKEYDGDIPKTVDDLLKLPGVGPKMAHLAMLCAWRQSSGIGVDTHVHKICNRLGWVQKATKTPEATRRSLEAWFPKELWPEINKLLVGFGQQICLSVNPRCEECLNKSICPYYDSTVKRKRKKTKN
ncbi:unnamed protein product [Soboliphyme baturini]|uniref:Endonuclease III homolog n=1 Tax=Soboliphyme baturini TaxID=241478 RepID=A0A183II64_9BILA|nr:unnamed protein product [Soboliphyme baturini]